MTNNKRWGYLAVGTVMMVLLGLIYAWSIFVAPLEAEFGWTRAETSLTFTICMSFFVIGLIANGFLSRRISARAVLLVSAVFLLAGFGACSRVTTVAGLYLAYGVLVGFAVGAANNALVSTLVKWFPGQTGLASGILMMGFGLGGMVLGSVATSLMQSIGWRSTFLLLGIGFAVIIALGSLAIKPPPAEIAAPARAAAPVTANPDRTAGEMLRRPSFWLYICWFTLVMAGGLIVIGHAAPFVGELLTPLQPDPAKIAAQAALFTGILSLCNGLGRVLTGVVYDRFGLRRSMLFTTLYLAVAAVLLIAAERLHSPALVVLGFIFTGLSYGGGPTTSSTFSSGFYGMRHFAMNYALVSAGLIPGALLGPYLAGVLHTASGGYLTSFLTMLVFAGVAVVFARLIRKP